MKYEILMIAGRTAQQNYCVGFCVKDMNNKMIGVLGFRSKNIQKNGRPDWIWTSDLHHPKVARYQAAPRADISKIWWTPVFLKSVDNVNI